MGVVYDDEFTECCGIRILYSATGSDEKDLAKAFTDAVAAHKVRPQLPEYPGDEARSAADLIECGEGDMEGLLLYASTHPRTDKALRGKRFKMLTEFRNPKTGNHIKLFGLVINQPKKKRKKARRG